MDDISVEPIRSYRIFLAAVPANLAAFCLGICMGWSSPAMPKLRNLSSESPLDSELTKQQEGSIISFLALAGLCVSTIAASLTGKIGRKTVLLLSSLLCTTSFVFLMVGKAVWLICVARILQGLSGGMVLSALPMYNTEIAIDDCRGAVGALLNLNITAGILYVFAIGPYVSYMILQCSCIVVSIVSFAAIIFMPESPYYFAIKRRTEDGIRSLQFLRGQSAKTAEKEMTQIQAAVDSDMANRGAICDIFQSHGYRKALIICFCLMSFQQSSGISAIVCNSQSIFSSAKTNLNPSVASNLMALFQLIFNLLSPVAIERIGRRPMLLISAFGMCLATVALGTFFYIKEIGDTSAIQWLPLPAMLLFYAMFSVGFGPVPYVLVGELLPINIKSNATSISCMITWLLSFVVTRWFPELNAFSPYYGFWIFGFLNGLAFVFVIFFVTETKGLSLQNIQEKLHS